MKQLNGRRCACGTMVPADEPICPACAKPVRSRGRFGRRIFIVRIVLGAVLIGFVSVYWWALISAPGAMLSGRQSVTEAATVALLRRIAMAEVTFQSATGRFGSMQELIDANLLAAGFEGPDPDYLYTVVVSSDDFVASAIPIGLNARYGFFIDGSGVAKYSTDPGLAPLGMAGAPVN